MGEYKKEELFFTRPSVIISSTTVVVKKSIFSLKKDQINQKIMFEQQPNHYEIVFKKEDDYLNVFDNKLIHSSIELSSSALESHINIIEGDILPFVDMLNNVRAQLENYKYKDIAMSVLRERETYTIKELEMISVYLENKIKEPDGKTRTLIREYRQSYYNKL